MTVKETTAQYGWLDLGLPDDFDSFVVKSTSAWHGELRLDGGYYDDKTVQALARLGNSGLKIETIKDVADTFNGARFRRVHVDDPEHGIPYLSPSDMFDARPRKERFLSRKHTGALDNLRVKEDWILITCSGSIGRCILAGRELIQFVMSHDLIRVVARQNCILPGYLYAYLSSSFGFSLLTRSNFGKVVDHIEPHQIDSMPIPRLDDEIEKSIHDRIIRAKSLRDEANELLDRAEAVLLLRTGLPSHDFSRSEWDEDALSNIVSSKKSSLRLDAGFHQQRAVLAEQEVKRLDWRPLGEVAKDIFQPNIFKRNYVQSDFGLPFCGTAEIMQVRPKPIRFLSRKTKDLQQYVVEAGWILLQRTGSLGGLLGRPTMLLTGSGGWCVSEDMIRIVPKNGVEAGYLYAFLESQYGYQLITKTAFGSAQDHVDVNWLSEVPIPCIAPLHREEISKLVLDAHSKRQEANDLEIAAGEMLMGAIS